MILKKLENLTEENKADLKTWVAALRSGKYNRGTYKLKQSDSVGNETYCCLGVWCDIFRGRTNLNWKSWNNINNIPLNPEWSISHSIGSNYSTVPSKLSFGIFDGSINVNYKGEVTSIMYLNDALQLPFSEIADAIEATYLN